MNCEEVMYAKYIVVVNEQLQLRHKIWNLLLPVLIITMTILGQSRLVAQQTAYATERRDTSSGIRDLLPEVPYVKPTQRMMVTNLMFDAIGPYPAVGAASVAGINQFSNSPPEWHQGMEGYGKRFGSDFAITAISTTARYGLAEAFKQDTLYYRCDCVGLVPRLKYAALSTLTGRRGVEGHRVFSFPALIAPYVGSMTAVYAWYPNRFGAKDAFRSGNYSLLSSMGSNIALEFFYHGPHPLLGHLHLNNRHSAPEVGEDK